MTSKNISRRNFLKASGVAAAAPYFIASTALGLDGETAPSERITMGAIGVGKQGRGDLKGFLRRNDTQMLAVCDVSAGSRNSAKSGVDAVNKNKDCKAYIDFRELLARDDIDAVMIATPHHWHASAIHMPNAVILSEVIENFYAEFNGYIKSETAVEKSFRLMGPFRRGAF